MAPVASRFDHQAFLALPMFLKQLEVIEDLKFSPILEKLSPVFVKFAVQDKFGLTIIHRHFDIEEGEIIVEVENQAKTRSISMPWLYNARNGTAVPKDPDFLSSEGIEIGETNSIFPKTWAFSPEGDLIPLEFQGAPDSFENVEQPSAAFLKDVFEILKNLGLLHIFGITRLGKEERSFETTDENRRINFIDYQVSSLEGGFTNVTWRFDKEGGFAEAGRCEGLGHDRGCRHCAGHGHARSCMRTRHRN